MAALLASCAYNQPPIEESIVVTRAAQGTAARVAPEFYVVRRGDTLYSIAFRYGLDFRVLAALNRIPDTYMIYPGQKLKLRGVARSGQPLVLAPVPAASSRAAPVTRPLAAPMPVPLGVVWQWPVASKVIGVFKPDRVGPKGIALDGKLGDPVRAAREGRVVYVGSSLIGYGQLVIIKHDDVYLSAYAHNSRVLVKEATVVRAGDIIAEMGASGTDRIQLHFEVRRNGEPIDPLLVLPRR